MQTGPAATLPCDVVLRDGSTINRRPAGVDDVDPLLAFFEGLSPESRYLRFFGIPRLDAGAARHEGPRSAAGGERRTAARDHANRGLHGAASASRLICFSIFRLMTKPIGSIR